MSGNGQQHPSGHHMPSTTRGWPALTALIPASRGLPSVQSKVGRSFAPHLIVFDLGRQRAKLRTWRSARPIWDSVSHAMLTRASHQVWPTRANSLRQRCHFLSCARCRAKSFFRAPHSPLARARRKSQHRRKATFDCQHDGSIFGGQTDIGLFRSVIRTGLPSHP